MTMHWGEFQTTAERRARGATEGDWRSGISRSYYAVFHFFREFLLSHGLDVGRGGQAHFTLYTGLWNCSFPAVAAVAKKINDLRIRRTAADYELHQSIRNPAALNAIRISRDIVKDFQATLATIPPGQIVDGARRHLQAIGRLGKTP
jgi:uncharacterized protein (UPF0332 family)